MERDPLFTVIMLTFNRPHMLKEAVGRLFAQTYHNLEIIIIDNASTQETKEYLSIIERQDARVKVVRFAENQYDPDDPMKYVGICYNAALAVATGDYVWHQDDDDFISYDFVEKMVRLFRENAECLTAAALPVYVDACGKTVAGHDLSNFRPRYMPGHILALDTLRKSGSIMFNAPGTIFAIKREALVDAGGYHPSIENSHLYGIVPFGITGFDQTAILYWRGHAGQMNVSLTANGHIGLKDTLSLLEEWQIRRRWEGRFGSSTAAYVQKALLDSQLENAASWFVHNLYSLYWKPAWRVFRQGSVFWRFWKKLPRSFWIKRGVFKRRIKAFFYAGYTANNG
jgi:glycosyltransferase involved in cell wall biosynthesis